MRTLSKNGVDVVKVMIDGELISSGGGIKPGVLGFTDEELEVLVGEAHHRGMRVACHARSAAAVKQAVKAASTSLAMRTIWMTKPWHSRGESRPRIRRPGGRLGDYFS